MTSDQKKFIVITSTYRRPETVMRTIDSVMRQTYRNWEFLLANDSPDDARYASVKKHIEDMHDPRIRYIKNDKNLGKNQSVNNMLSLAASEKNMQGFAVFLDDDDWLDPATLEQASKEIDQYPGMDWYVSNRAIEKTGVSLTRVKTSRSTLSYFWDYLIRRVISGDATHVILLSAATAARYPASVRNGEEWFYFSQIRPKRFHYYPYHSTWSERYDEGGVTHLLSSKKRLANTWPLFVESLRMATISPLARPSMLIYFIARIIKTGSKIVRESLR